MGIQYSLVNLVWDTVFTGSYGGTVFPEEIRYSLVNNVCGYDIHWDTGFTLTLALSSPTWDTLLE